MNPSRTYIYVSTMLMVLTFIFSINATAQRGQNRGNQTALVVGKAIDETSKQGLPYAVVRIFKLPSNRLDTASFQLIGGAMTATNGDFSCDNIPIGEELQVEISFVGYETFQQVFKIQGPGEMGVIRKDLGNLMLHASNLEALVVEGNTDFKLEFDRRVYDVEKNPANAGGTAEDVLRNIPSVQVDMDGNVSMRNAAPQIFVDGRPSTLTIDQIPADAIQKVEIISNPSAKYDASGGGGGIVNIVMKHNRGMGYNGSLRVGGDSRPRFNAGIDLNLREGKFNFFFNANGNQRKSISEGTTERLSYTNIPNTFLDQTQSSVNLGYFANMKGGVDWFIDNRNTLTVSESYTEGKFSPTDTISAHTDTLLIPIDPDPFSAYTRSSSTTRRFRNVGTSLLYKHLFAQEGKELSADINFNKISSTFIGDYINRYSTGITSKQRQDGGGSQELITSQIDYTNKINDRYKVELGARGSMRHYESLYKNYIFEGNAYTPIQGLFVNYEFLDQVYAGYGTLSRNGEKWKIQLGLRAESSNYLGKLRDTTLTFTVQYPLSLFPSAFITRSLTEKQDIQLAVSRKISRPSFMQLIPFVDYSDSLNVSRGNPGLKPEFTNLAEFSYQNTESPKFTFIASSYARFITNLTVRNQVVEYSDVLEQNIVINTYDNAQSSMAFGLELVGRWSPKKWLEMTINLNGYQSSIDGTNISPNLTNSRASWWAKTNAVFRLPKGFMIQLMADYSSKKALSVGSSERAGNMGGGEGGGRMGGMGGGGGFGGGNDNTVQGYVLPTYALDVSIRKEFGKARNVIVSIAMQDVMRTRVQYTHSETDLFIQDTFRRRDWQVLRVNLNWKFGKVDSSLFKRKNMKQGGEGMEG